MYSVIKVRARSTFHFLSYVFLFVLSLALPIAQYHSHGTVQFEFYFIFLLRKYYLLFCNFIWSVLDNLFCILIVVEDYTYGDILDNIEISIDFWGMVLLFVAGETMEGVLYGERGAWCQTYNYLHILKIRSFEHWTTF